MWTEIKFLEVALPPPPAAPAVLQGVAGAWAEFHGYVRADEKGQKIAGLRYDFYESMARKQLEKHMAMLGQKYGLVAARFWHRTGVVPVGEASVYAAVAAPHRQEAFAALTELMNLLKTDVPIWKVEVLPA